MCEREKHSFTCFPGKKVQILTLLHACAAEHGGKRMPEITDFTAGFTTDSALRGREAAVSMRESECQRRSEQLEQVLSYLLYWYKCTNTDEQSSWRRYSGTCFTGTKVQILTHRAVGAGVRAAGGGGAGGAQQASLSRALIEP